MKEVDPRWAQGHPAVGHTQGEQVPLVMPTQQLRWQNKALLYSLSMRDFCCSEADHKNHPPIAQLMTHSCRCRRFPGWHIHRLQAQNPLWFLTTSCDKLLHQKPGFLLWELKQLTQETCTERAWNGSKVSKPCWFPACVFNTICQNWLLWLLSEARVLAKSCNFLNNREHFLLS